MADRTGFEPAISSVTGRRDNRASLPVLNLTVRIYHSLILLASMLKWNRYAHAKRCLFLS